MLTTGIILGVKWETEKSNYCTLFNRISGKLSFPQRNCEANVYRVAFRKQNRIDFVHLMSYKNKLLGHVNFVFEDDIY